MNNFYSTKKFIRGYGDINNDLTDITINIDDIQTIEPFKHNETKEVTRISFKSTQTSILINESYSTFIQDITY